MLEPSGDPRHDAPGLMVHRGRLWVTGKTVERRRDRRAFVARVEADGTGLQSRQFDIRGKLHRHRRRRLSQAGDLTVLAGPPETLVVVGRSVTTERQLGVFAAAAFNGFEGDLAPLRSARYVDGGSNQVGLARPRRPRRPVLGRGRRLTAQSVVVRHELTRRLRLLLDADKKCDLALDVPTPLELTFVGRKGTAAQISVENKGERPCGGEVTVAAPYKLGRAVSTGVIEPGAKFVTSNVPITSSTIRRDDDVAKFSISVPGDGDTSNDVRGVRAVYSFCDLALSAVEKPSTIPNEGGRRVEVGVRNSGTRTCRSVKFSVPNGAGEGASKPYAIERGRSVSDDVWVSSKSTAKVGKKATVTVKSASADEDVVAKNDSIRLTARVVGVGDTRVRATERHPHLRLRDRRQGHEGGPQRHQAHPRGGRHPQARQRLPLAERQEVHEPQDGLVHAVRLADGVGQGLVEPAPHQAPGRPLRGLHARGHGERLQGRPLLHQGRQPPRLPRALTNLKGLAL